MGYKIYGRCKKCKKIYRYGFVPHICKKCGCALFKDSLIFGALPTENLEVVTAKKKFPFGYEVKESDDKCQ